jgi:probable rRNA maturation factor
MSGRGDREARIAVRIVDGGWPRALPEARAVAERAARAALAAHGAKTPAAVEVSIALGDDALLARLNRDWRGVEGATNVLSFPSSGARSSSHEQGSHRGSPLVLGDVVLARETVFAEAAAQKKTLAAHASHLVVHGVLHLLGHNHGTEREADAMEGLETRILAALGIGDPYAAAPSGGRAQAMVER